MTTILIIIHVIVCLFLIAIVLLQHGKGADVGATFGGASQSLFGTEGPIPLLNKITTASAIVFMATSISLAYISANKSSSTLMKGVESTSLPALPPLELPVETQGPVTIPMPEQTGEPSATPQEMPVEGAAPLATMTVDENAPQPVAVEPPAPAQEQKQ